MNGCHQKAESEEDKAVWPLAIRESFLEGPGQELTCDLGLHVLAVSVPPGTFLSILLAFFVWIIFLSQCFNSTVLQIVHLTLPNAGFSSVRLESDFWLRMQSLAL